MEAKFSLQLLLAHSQYKRKLNIYVFCLVLGYLLQ